VDFISPIKLYNHDYRRDEIHIAGLLISISSNVDFISSVIMIV